jgi:hypothetical protein
MKYGYFLIVCLVVSFVTVNAATKFKQGDKVNVWVLKGLKLYQKPDSKSLQLATVAYGSTVEVLSNDADSLKAYNGKITNDITPVPVTLKGHWVKVNYGQKQGYTFDGYLSKMPCLKLTNKYSEDVVEYVKRNYKGYTKKVSKKVVEGTDFEETMYYYKGALILKKSSGDGCFDTEIFLKGVSYQDAHLFEKLYLNGADASQDIKVKQLKNNTVKISFYSCD